MKRANPLHHWMLTAGVIVAAGGMGCATYSVVMDSEYVPDADKKLKISVLGTIAPKNDTGGWYVLGHSSSTDFDRETLNLIADKLQRNFNESPWFTTYDKVDLEKIIAAQNVEETDLFDRTGQVLASVGQLQTTDALVIARISRSVSAFYPTFTWWNTIEVELKMVDIRTGQIYLSGYAGGRYFFPFSRDLLLERIVGKLFKELRDELDGRSVASVGRRATDGFEALEREEAGTGS